MTSMDNRREPPADIILIGPVRSGKSTQGKLLAGKLGVPQFSLDKLRWDYFAEIGYDEAEEDRIMEAEGWPGVLAYWKPFEPHALERLLTEHPGGVVDLGAGQSVYAEEELFARVQKTLAPYPNVILLLPSPDLDASVRISKERQGHQTWYENDFDEHFIKHPSNHRLAKFVVYTEGKTPEQTCEEILGMLSHFPEAQSMVE